MLAITDLNAEFAKLKMSRGRTSQTTLHPADRSDIRPPLADKCGGAPSSTLPFAITVNHAIQRDAGSKRLESHFGLAGALLCRFGQFGHGRFGQ